MRNPYAWLSGAENEAECLLIGTEPQAFLNRCAAAGIRLDGVEALSAAEMRVTLALRDLERAVQLALRSQCELKPLYRRGVRVWGRRLLRRWLPALCLPAAFFLLAWSKLYIWEIEVAGNETLSAGVIRGALSDCGVGIGSFWPDLVSDNLRSELLIRLPQLAWATVNVYGSRAEVIVRERIPKPVLFDADAAVDLVADRVGFVTEVRALCGTAVVRPGSAVCPGDLLIEGRTDSAFSGSRDTHALGSVTAETCYTLCTVGPETETVRSEATETKERWALLLGKRRINFYRSSSFCPVDCDKIESIWECKIKGLFTLPVALLRERVTAYEKTGRQRDKNVLRREMEQQLHARLLADVGDGTIEEENYTWSESEGRIVFCRRARCSENIAKEQRK